MAISTLTWSVPYYGANIGTAHDAPIAFTRLYAALAAADDAADFPWVVCSYDITHAEQRYITLKRKDTSAGRIVFLLAMAGSVGDYNDNIRCAVGVPYNMMTCCYIAGATSDTPANLRGSSGSIFTGEDFANSSPVASSVTAYANSTTDKWLISATADTIIAFRVNNTGTWYDSYPMMYVGLILANPGADTVKAGAMCCDVATWIPAVTPAHSNNNGVMAFGPSAQVQHWGKFFAYDPYFMPNRTRDLAAKKIYFPPFELGSYQAERGDASFAYQLRQVAGYTTPLAGDEVLSDGTNVLARSVGKGTAVSESWWLVNSKLHA